MNSRTQSKFNIAIATIQGQCAEVKHLSESENIHAITVGCKICHLASTRRIVSLVAVLDPGIKINGVINGLM